MKPLFYAVLFLVILPVQASLLDPFSLAGIKPDVALILIYIIGLLTGPMEGALSGIAIGLIQDIGSANLIGLSGLTRGLVGVLAGVLGRRVLDLASPSSSLFLAGFTLLEGIGVALFLQLFYGSVPFFSLLGGRILPQAIYTGVISMFLLRQAGKKEVRAAVTRRGMQKEL